MEKKTSVSRPLGARIRVHLPLAVTRRQKPPGTGWKKNKGLTEKRGGPKRKGKGRVVPQLNNLLKKGKE